MARSVLHSAECSNIFEEGSKMAADVAIPLFYLVSWSLQNIYSFLSKYSGSWYLYKTLFLLRLYVEIDFHCQWNRILQEHNWIFWRVNLNLPRARVVKLARGDVGSVHWSVTLVLFLQCRFIDKNDVQFS